MELPVAPASYRPTPQTLVRAVKQGRLVLAQAAAQETLLDGATVYVNPARPQVALANFAAELRVPEGETAARVLDQVVAHFQAARTPCHSLQCSDETWPTELVAQVERRGFCAGPARQVCVLERFMRPARPHPGLQIIPARAVYAETRLVYYEDALAGDGGKGGTDNAWAEAWADTRIDHLDESRLEVFLARVSGQPAGVVGVLTAGSVGLIDHVLVLPRFRKRGIGSALMVQAVEHCGRALFAQVILEVQQGSAAAAWLQAMGYHAVASFVEYVRAESLPR